MNSALTVVMMLTITNTKAAKGHDAGAKTATVGDADVTYATVPDTKNFQA